MWWTMWSFPPQKGMPAGHWNPNICHSLLGRGSSSSSGFGIRERGAMSKGNGRNDPIRVADLSLRRLQSDPATPRVTCPGAVRGRLRL